MIKKITIVLSILSACCAWAQDGVVRLELGKGVTDRVGPGQVRGFAIKVDAGQFFALRFTQPGAQTIGTLQFGGTALTELHWPVDTGTEPLVWVATEPGEYRVELSRPKGAGLAQPFKIELTDLRSSVVEDAKRLRVQQLFEEARNATLHKDYSQKQTALESVLRLSKELGDRDAEARAWSGLGDTFRVLGKYQNAVDDYQNAVQASRDSRDTVLLANMEIHLGKTLGSQSENEKALALFQDAARISREAQDQATEAEALTVLAYSDTDLGQYERAVENAGRAVAIQHDMNNQRGEARALAGIGDALNHLGKYEKAIERYQAMVALARAVPDRQQESIAMNGLGNGYSYMSQYDRALSYYQDALAITVDREDKRLQGTLLTNIGICYFYLSQYQKAIDAYERSIALKEEIGNRIEAGWTRNSLGNVYERLGQFDKSKAYFEQALTIAREVKDREGEGYALTDLGESYLNRKDVRKARGYFEEALNIAKESKDRASEAIHLISLGDSYLIEKRFDVARPYYESALAISREVHDRDTEAIALSSLGQSSKGARAAAYYQQALLVARDIKNRDTELNALSGLMDSWSKQGRPRLAIFYGKQSVNTIQSVRSDIRGLSQESQKGFVSTNEAPYHKLAELLIAQGRLAEAEEVLALLKEEEYFQYIRREAAQGSGLTRRAGLTSEESEWEKRYREIGDNLMAIGAERGELLGKKDLTAEDTAKLAQIESQLAVGNQKFEQFLGKMVQHFSAKAEGTRRATELRETQGIMEDLRELPAGTVAVFTLVGTNYVHTILRTPDAQKAYQHKIPAAELGKKVLEFRDAVKDPSREVRTLGQDLYAILIGPMAQDLKQAKARTLMWSLDGVLRYVPLAALYDGKHYLVEQYRVSVMTLAGNTRLKDMPDSKWTAAGFGVTKSFEGADALPSVANELSGIIHSQPGDMGVLGGEIRLDGDFTQQTMRQTLLKHYPVVHIASHFRFQPGDETRSFLLLGDGGHLSLAELKMSANLFGGVQLLTLSACNTGVGDGSEVEGFGTLAQRQGAKAVIASLWPVADESTSLLMQEFYRIREATADGTKLEALRQAQLSLLNGTTGRTVTGGDRGLIHEDTRKNAAVTSPKLSRDPKAPFAHPYFWAPFFLMGNWL